MSRTFSNAIGFDDAPPEPGHPAGRRRLLGVVTAGTRLDGLLSGWIERDGDEATGRIIELVRGSRFDEHIQLILLQGITFAGFDVVDIARIAHETARPVLVVARRAPRLPKIRSALQNVPEPERRWARIEAAGPMEPLAGVHVQRAGLSLEEARSALSQLTLHGALPEPLRLAHIIAGGVASGQSRGRA